MQAAAETVGKAALAQALDWTRPKLDRRLKSDASFPVVNVGDQAGGWQFDVAAVKAHLGLAAPKPAKGKHAPPPAAPQPALDPAQLRDAVAPAQPAGARTVHLPPSKPRKSAAHQGEATARQRKDNADAALRENKLKLENGQLVDRAELRQTLAQVFASIGNDLEAMPDEIVKALGLHEEKVPAVRELVDKIRTRMVQNAVPLLAEPEGDE